MYLGFVQKELIEKKVDDNMKQDISPQPSWDCSLVLVWLRSTHLQQRKERKKERNNEVKKE